MVHFTKPAWVIHKDPSKSDHSPKRLSIFSVHVHPDGSRIATGGLDSKIRIWSTKPILSRSSDQSGKPPKSLCTLHMHTGPVLTVRWAHSGRWLASGSDDAIVMIWDLDPNACGKVWGSDEVNIEGWKPLKRLPGHDSDVTDVAWSPGDRYLASVGLDSTVIIWCGFTLERIVRLNQHQGFVKGVCWDPVGEFLATQSDDRTVKIWRTTDWSLEKTVSKPFEASPGSTFFRRLSWSPDGAHITASNATNNNGYVFIAAVITRNSWTSDISLVGHENTIEVAAYNPHIFLRNPAEPVATYNICSVVALGADDRSVSVWQTKSARPLIVAKEVFDRQIMDLSWSWDGMTLYAASSDGTIAVFHFDPKELEGIAPHSVQQQYLTKFGFTPPPLPEGFSHVPTCEPTQMTPPPSPTRANGQVSTSAQVATPTSFPTTNGRERVNVLVAKRGNKKRAALSSSAMNGRLNTSIGVTGSFIPSASTSPSKRVQLAHRQDVQRFPSPSEQPFGAPDSWSLDADVAMDIDFDVPIDALDTKLSQAKGRRTAIGDLLDEVKPPKARTLGGDRYREVAQVKQIGTVVPTPAMSVEVQRGMMLPVPALLTYLTSELDGTDDVLEAENAEEIAGTNEVSFVSGQQTQWLDFLPSPVLALKATSFLCAVAMQDGSINVYSHTGRRLMPTMSIGSPCSFIDGNKHSLMVITSSGQLFSWNMKKVTTHFPPISVLPLLASSPNHTITSASVRPNGIPIIHTSNGIAYSYDTSLSTWVKISERWWAEGSDAWQGRQRAATTAASNRGIMSMVEGSVNGTPPPDEIPPDKRRPEWWNAALTLGHLETKLHGTKLLDSPQEYKQALLVYAKKIADEGFRAKGEELIKELFGPMYWRPGREDSWAPTVAGLPKRELLKEVLSVFARSKTLTKLALDWQDILKRAVTDEL